LCRFVELFYELYDREPVLYRWELVVFSIDSEFIHLLMTRSIYSFDGLCFVDGFFFPIVADIFERIEGFSSDLDRSLVSEDEE